MKYLFLILIFASCQPVGRYERLQPTEDSAEIKDCENRLQECAESNQVLLDSIYHLTNKK